MAGASTSGTNAIFRQRRQPQSLVEAILPQLVADVVRSHSRELPANLLCGYKMQWALNRHLGLRADNRCILVNAYKLATQSTTFRKLIKDIDDQQKRHHANRSNAQQQLQEIPLLIDCHRSADINDLAFAVHFCHLGRCQVSATSAIERSDTPPMKRRGDQELRVVGTDEVILSTGQVHMTSNSAECSLTCGLRVANTYGIKSLHKLCISYIVDNLTNETCWSLWKAIFIRPTTMLDKQIVQVDARACKVLEKFMHANFRTFIHQDNLSDDYFANLSAPELEVILASERLNVRSESEVVEALSLWIDARSREPDAESYLPKVIPRLIDHCLRVDQLSIEQVDLLLKFPGMRQKKNNPGATQNTHEPVTPDHHPPPCSTTSTKPSSSSSSSTIAPIIPWKGDVRSMCIAMLHQTRRRLVRTTRNLRPLSSSAQESISEKATGSQPGATEATSAEALLTNKNKLPTRIPHEAIIVLGGWENGQPCRNARVLDSRKKTWVSQNDPSESNLVLPHPLMSFGITNVANQAIYIAGGESRSGQATQEVLRYEFTTVSNTGWKGCAPMHDIRRDLVLVNFQDKALYAIGGDNNRVVLDSVESLSLEPKAKKNNWIEMACMIIPRGAPAGDTVGGRIYVCGGYTESRMESLTSSCEAYNPETNQWTLVQPMAQPRYYASAVTYADHLFVLGGGGDNSSRLASSVMALGYSSTVERFSPDGGIWELMPAISERADFAACVHEDEIFCIGGGGEAFCTAEIESWRPWIGRVRGPEPASAPGGVWGSSWQNDVARDEYAAPTAVEVGAGSGSPPTPIWMPQNEGDFPDGNGEIPGQASSSTTQTPQAQLEGWHSRVQLPIPLWGHRCVSIRGVERIMPLIKREEDSSINATTALKCVVELRWKITKNDGKTILAIRDSCEPILEDENEEADESGGEEEQESNECGQGAQKMEVRIGKKITVVEY